MVDIYKINIHSSRFITGVNIDIKVLYTSLTIIIIIIFITFILSKVLLKGFLGLLLFLFSLFLLSLFQCVVMRIISFLITDEALKLLSWVQILILTIYNSLITITGQIIVIIITVVMPICIIHFIYSPMRFPYKSIQTVLAIIRKILLYLFRGKNLASVQEKYLA